MNQIEAFAKVVYNEISQQKNITIFKKMPNETSSDLLRNKDFVNYDSKRKNRSRYMLLDEDSGQKRQRVLIHGAAFVVTADENDKLQLKADHSVYIVDGKIKEVFPAEKGHIPLKDIDLIYDASKRGGIVISPGFVNAHAHPPMYMLRSSMTLDKGNIVGQVAKMARLEGKMTEEDFFLGALGDFTEEQKNGITTTLSHYGIFNPVEEAAKSSRQNVINAISAVSNSHPENNPDMVEEILRHRDEYFTKPAIAVHYLHKASKEQLKRIGKLIKEYDVLFTMHAAESEEWVQENVRKFGSRTVETLEQMGMASSNIILSHCVHVSGREIDLIKKNKIGVVHLPTSNKLHKSGEFDFTEFVKRGAEDRVCLGTDSVISKNSLDLLSEALQTRIMHLHKHRVLYEDLFRMATSRAADILKLGKVGRILPGYRADISFWKLKDRGFLPYNEKEPLSLVGNMITHGGRNIRDLMIDGQFVISNRVHNLVDESALLMKLQEAHNELRSRIDK